MKDQHEKLSGVCGGKNKKVKIMNTYFIKKILIISIVISISLITPKIVKADCQGCCSSHGGVVCRGGITQCADGTELSQICLDKGCDVCIENTADSIIKPKPDPVYIPSTKFYTNVSKDRLNNIQESKIKEIENLINKYDKQLIINLIREKRDNQITLKVDDELRDFMGPPNEKYVTSETILIDLENIGLKIEDFEKILETNKILNKK